MSKPKMTLAQFQAINNNNNNTKENTVNLTPEQLQQLINNAVQTAIASIPQAQPAATSEKKAGLKHGETFISKCWSKTTEATKWAADKTEKNILPMAETAEIYTREQMIPDALTVTSKGASKLSTWTDKLAKASAAKAEAMRPKVETNAAVAALESLSKEELIALIAKKLN